MSQSLSQLFVFVLFSRYDGFCISLLHLDLFVFPFLL